MAKVLRLLLVIIHCQILSLPLYAQESGIVDMGFTDKDGNRLYWLSNDIGRRSDGTVEILADTQSKFSYQGAVNAANTLNYTIPSLDDYERLIEFSTLSIQHRDESYSLNDIYCDMPYWIQGSWASENNSTDETVFRIEGYCYKVYYERPFFGHDYGMIEMRDGKLIIGNRTFTINASNHTLVNSDGGVYKNVVRPKSIDNTILVFKSKINGQTLKFSIEPNVEGYVAQARTAINTITALLTDVPVNIYWTNTSVETDPQKKYVVSLSEAEDACGSKLLNVMKTAKLRLVKKDNSISSEKNALMDSSAELVASLISEGYSEEDIRSVMLSSLQNCYDEDYEERKLNPIVLTDSDIDVIMARSNPLTEKIEATKEEARIAENEALKLQEAHNDSVIAASPFLTGIANVCKFAEDNKNKLFHFRVGIDDNSVRIRVCVNKTTQKLYADFWKVVKKYCKPNFAQERGEGTANNVKGKSSEPYLLENEYNLYIATERGGVKSANVNGKSVGFDVQYYRTRYQNPNLSTEEIILFDSLLERLNKIAQSSIESFAGQIEANKYGDVVDTEPSVKIEPICPLSWTLYYCYYEGGLSLERGNRYKMPFLQYKYDKEIPLYEVRIDFKEGTRPSVSTYGFDAKEVNNNAATLFEGSAYERKYDKFYDKNKSYRE